MGVVDVEDVTDITPEDTPAAEQDELQQPKPDAV